MVNAGDDDGEEEESEEQTRSDRPTDFESILTISRTRGISERMLAWHYRSKHPSLIALSNEECYAGRLLLPPSPFVQTSEFGLSLVQTPRGHYDRGGTRCDLVQAKEVAKAVAQHIRRYPFKSLGVACLSVQQRDAVIAPTEYQMALSIIISDAVTISREDLVVETARLFGFDRTGPDLKEAIDRQAAKLVNAGRLRREGNVLRHAEDRPVLH